MFRMIVIAKNSEFPTVSGALPGSVAARSAQEALNTRTLTPDHSAHNDGGFPPFTPAVASLRSN